MTFYSVAIGRVPGIYTTWAECEKQTKKFSNAKYKKFGTQAEADAFIRDDGAPVVTPILAVHIPPTATLDAAPNACPGATPITKRARSPTPDTTSK